MIRRVLPKDTSFKRLTQHDISTMASVVSNYLRREASRSDSHQIHSLFQLSVFLA